VGTYKLYLCIILFDFVVRAKDYHKKQDHIKKLKKKADDRNIDEFYFKMNKTEVAGGIHKDIKEDSSLDIATVKLLKTQDLGYIIHKKAIDDKKIEKLTKNLHFIGDKKPKNHIKFMETEEEFEETKKEIEKIQVDVEKDDDQTNKILLKMKKNINRDIKKSYSELKQRINRSEKIKNVLDHLQMQRNIMGKGTKRKITTVNDNDENNRKPPVYKWKRERTR
jgi:U3 small nucleolar RNA-associated protein 11